MLRQIAAVTLLSLRSIPQRLGASIVVVIGLAAVVGVLVSVFTMAGSLTTSLISVGSADRAIVLRDGARFEGESALPLDTAAIVANVPGVARTPEGRGAVTRDIVTAVNRPWRSNGALRALAVRGVGTDNFVVRPEIVIVEGRSFTPGLREAIVGSSAQVQFEGLGLGSEVKLRDGVWTIVGVFTTGDATEAGLIMDVDTLASAYGLGHVNSVTARLETPAAFDTLKAALDAHPTLAADVYREPDYYVMDAADLDDLFFFVTYVICSIMAAGALVGALNTMYAAVSSRTVEIATLRALGFGAAGVVVSVVAESLLLATLGATAGSVIAWLIFSGDSVSLGGQNGTLITTLAITPATLVTGLLWAVGVGFIGAVFPAVRAGRLPLATALRAT
ncbi:MAG TPA: ABC transporter permease [Gammaproteobacteria bacterium]